MKAWRVVRTILWGILGWGAGLLLGWHAPPLLWPVALVLVAVWLARWPKPGVGLLAVTFGVMLASPFVRNLDTQAPVAQGRSVVSTPQEAQTWTGVHTLSVRNSAGDITVTGGRPWGLRASYRWGAHARGRGLPEELLSARRGTTLDFTGLEPTWPQELLREAEAQLRAAVPRRTSLLVDARSGDVKAQNLTSAHVETNLGDVTLSNIAGAAVALTDVGNVYISEVEGAIEAATLMGDIWLEPRLGASDVTAPILAKAEVGDIALLLPPGTDARIVATSASRELPKNFRRVSPTRGELVLGEGSRLIVLTTRIGKISLVQR